MCGQPWQSKRQALSHHPGKQLKRRLAGSILILIRKITRSLNLSTAEYFGRILGDLAFFLSGKFRRRTIDNIKIAQGKVLSPAEQYALAQNMFRNFGINLCVSLKAQSMTSDEFVELTESGDAERILQENTLSKGRSAMIITAHYSNWELFVSSMLQIAPLTVLARTNSNPWIQELIDEMRGSTDVRVVDRDDRRAGRIIKQIGMEGGHILGILMDVDTRVASIYSPFLGVPAKTPSGPAAIAIKGWFDVYAGFIYRETDGIYSIRFTGPLEITKTGDRGHDLQVNTDLFNRIISEQIMEDPAQWTWIHRRWRTRPGQDGG